MIELLLPILFLSSVLVAIHSYFGLRILKRGIIFTDLAIGQIAAVGSSISVAFFEAQFLYLWTLGFALFGAALIQYAVRSLRHIEAFIGLLYVLGASSVMLILSHSPEGSEHFNALLAADILFTSESHILSATAIYALVGLLLWYLMPRIKTSYQELLFFTLLAVTVTSSVQLAGVLVVFVLLIAPALLALMQQRFNPYGVAVTIGSLLSWAAIISSFYLDLPTGYSIVFFTALSAVFVALFKDRKD